MLNLRPDQKEVLKWIVARIEEGELRAEFEVRTGAQECTVFIPEKPRAVAKGGLHITASGVRYDPIPGGTIGALNALVQADCLQNIEINVPAKFGVRLYSVTNIGFEAVRSNFADAPKATPHAVTTNFHTQIHGGTGIQVGQHNTMEVKTAVQNLARIIEESAATPAQKAEAKSALTKFVEHDAFKAVLGTLASGAAEGVAKGLKG